MPLARLDRASAKLATAIAVTGVALTPKAANAAYPGLSIKTTEGEMQFELWDDVAPKHVESFLKLAKQGFFDGVKKFFDDLTN